MTARHYAKKEMIPGTIFRVEELLGSGGMGIVYRAEELAINRMVAVKTLRAELAHRKDLRSLFVAEGKLLGSLDDHPNIVQVITQGFTADELDLPFIAMEYLNGVSARKIIASRGRLDLSLAVEMINGVLLALSYAHDKGVVHRDVKPDNIFTHQKRDGTSTAKLIDFGIHDTGKTKKGRIVGTPLYAPPEQMGAALEGLPVDNKAFGPQADIYSVAVTLYEFITGHTPFESEPNDRAVIEAHRLKAPPPPSTFVSMPVALEDAILKGLEKDPRKRWSSAFGFGTALLNSIEGWARAGGGDSRDPSGRITVEQVPTHVGIPIDQTNSSSQPPSGVRTNPDSDDDGEQPTIDASTEPGVPLEVLRMMMDKVTAAATEAPSRTTPPPAPPESISPGSPTARDKANGVWDKTAPIPPGPGPRAHTMESATPDGMPVAHPRQDLDRRRLSDVATRSLRTPKQQDEPPRPGAREMTPLVPLPPVRDDPAAPEAIRQGPRATTPRPTPAPTPLPTPPPEPGDGVPPDVDARLRRARDVSPEASLGPLLSPEERRRHAQPSPMAAPSPTTPAPTASNKTPPAVAPRPPRAWHAEYRELMALLDAVRRGVIPQSSVRLSQRQKTLARLLTRVRFLRTRILWPALTVLTLALVAALAFKFLRR